MMRLPLFAVVSFAGFLGACATVSIPPNASSIALDKAVHFSAPDGSDAIAPPGTYQVERIEETQIRLVPVGQEEQKNTVIVQAIATQPDESLGGPLALSIPYKEDEHHIVLLMPDGKALDAMGSYSGVRSRAELFPLPTMTIRPYTKMSLNLALSPNPTYGGTVVNGIVSLGIVAPGNGVVVSVFSNVPALAQVPSSIKVAGGQTQATFPIYTAQVQNTASVPISASTAGIMRTVSLTVMRLPQAQCPPSAAAPCSNNGSCNPSTGQCDCYLGFNGNACQYGNVSTCNAHGTVDYLGGCTCNQGYTGQNCQMCAANFSDYPTCH